MAMTMTGEATLPAGRSEVWAMLNDPAVLKACIPGCQSLERTGDNGFAAVAKVRIGPVAATFKGNVELSDIVPEVGYRIAGEGEGGVAGFAKGAANVSLADAGAGTQLRYDVEAHVGGKIAQLGSRLIDGVAKNMADKFFASFAEAAARGLPLHQAALGRPPPPPSKCHRQQENPGSGGYGNGSCLYDGKRPARFGRGRPENAALAVPARDLRLTGTHIGCDTSQCGVCVVHVDGEAVKSCTALAASCDGANVTTIEGRRTTASFIRCSRPSRTTTACSAASARRE